MSLYRSVSAAIFFAASSALAYADDFPSKTNWTGFYIGANGGYAFGDGDKSDISVFNNNGRIPTNFPLSYELKPEGGFWGGQVGYNHQFDHIVVGVEADIQDADIDDHSVTTFTNPGNPNQISSFSYDAETKIDWFGTVRGRLGFAFDRTLVYATGGYAFGEVSYNAIYDFPPPGPGQSFGPAKFKDRSEGYVLGAGIEHAFCDNLSLKVEYQYVNLDDHDVSGALFFANGRPSGETFKSDLDTEFHTVRVGLNYKFGERRAEAPPPLK